MTQQEPEPQLVEVPASRIVFQQWTWQYRRQQGLQDDAAWAAVSEIFWSIVTAKMQDGLTADPQECLIEAVATLRAAFRKPTEH